jgi:hypothetical protein
MIPMVSHIEITVLIEVQSFRMTELIFCVSIIISAHHHTSSDFTVTTACHSIIHTFSGINGTSSIHKCSTRAMQLCQIVSFSFCTSHYYSSCTILHPFHVSIVQVISHVDGLFFIHKHLMRFFELIKTIFLSVSTRNDCLSYLLSEIVVLHISYKHSRRDNLDCPSLIPISRCCRQRVHLLYHIRETIVSLDYSNSHRKWVPSLLYRLVSRSSGPYNWCNPFPSPWPPATTWPTMRPYSQATMRSLKWSAT